MGLLYCNVVMISFTLPVVKGAEFETMRNNANKKVASRSTMNSCQ
jgi:hypothetical protein